MGEGEERGEASGLRVREDLAVRWEDGAQAGGWTGGPGWLKDRGELRVLMSNWKASAGGRTAV